MNCTAAELGAHGDELVSRGGGLDVPRLSCVPMPVVVLGSGDGDVAGISGETMSSTEAARRGRFAAGRSTAFPRLGRLGLRLWLGP